MRRIIKNAKRIVVKAGTSILTSKDGWISEKNLASLGRQILQVRKQGHEVALVSSGAIAYGMEVAGIKSRPKEMASLQACAAIGQGKLMHAYEKFFNAHDVLTAQLLLTRDGLEVRNRFLAARQTFESLFDMKTLPIINENDTVATEEIAFGDNDILSVQVAHVIHADLLIILSDVDGFFLRDGSRIREVLSEEDIDKVLIPHIRDKKRETTVGGMRAKMHAARIAMRLGVSLLILNGHDETAMLRALQGEDVGTLFHADKSSGNARKKWIAYSAARKGSVVVDDGAYHALIKNKSLLPSGMVKVKGHFDRGQVVEIERLDGNVFGRGVARYGSRELAQLVGKKTQEIQKILGYKDHDEVIHSNDMVLWG